eukprot:Opistho-2@92411
MSTPWLSRQRRTAVLRACTWLIWWAGLLWSWTTAMRRTSQTTLSRSVPGNKRSGRRWHRLPQMTACVAMPSWHCKHCRHATRTPVSTAVPALRKIRTRTASVLQTTPEITAKPPPNKPARTSPARSTRTAPMLPMEPTSTLVPARKDMTAMARCSALRSTDAMHSRAPRMQRAHRQAPEPARATVMLRTRETHTPRDVRRSTGAQSPLHLACPRHTATILAPTSSSVSVPRTSAETASRSASSSLRRTPLSLAPLDRLFSTRATFSTMLQMSRCRSVSRRSARAHSSRVKTRPTASSSFVSTVSVPS